MRKILLVFLLVFFVACQGAVEKQPDAECQTKADCVISGCSGEVCGPNLGEGKEMATICEYKEIYGCYKLASCACVNGNCAWSGGQEFKECYDANK